MGRQNLKQEYRRRAQRYARWGTAGMLLIAVPILLWSSSQLKLWSRGWLGLPDLVWALVPVLIGASLLTWARLAFRCPSCERTLPRQRPDIFDCPHCGAKLRDACDR